MGGSRDNLRNFVSCGLYLAQLHLALSEMLQ